VNVKIKGQNHVDLLCGQGVIHYELIPRKQVYKIFGFLSKRSNLWPNKWILYHNNTALLA
jgi:hypothetical protein